MTRLIVAAVVTFAFAGAAPLAAAPCKDAQGKFVKCPEKAKSAGRCKDGKGKFVKCGSPGAKLA